MLTKERNNPIHIREIIIAAVITLAVLTLGGIFDFDLSAKVYNPINTNWYGIIGAAIVELPVCAGLIFGGISLIIGCPLSKDHPKRKILFILMCILGGAAVLVGAYFLFDTFKDISDFQRLQDHKTLITILAIVFALLITALVAYFAVFKTKNVDKKVLFIIGVSLLVIAAGAAIVGNVGKFLWSRPRPRFIFAQSNSQALFHPFWELHPFDCLKKDLYENATSFAYLNKSDSLKSFPSGHTVYSATGMFLLPWLTLLSDKTKNNRLLQICLFYVALAYALVAGLSRVYAGAHFLSDTAVGILVTLIVGFVINLILFKKPKEASEVKEAE